MVWVSWTGPLVTLVAVGSVAVASWVVAIVPIALTWSDSVKEALEEGLGVVFAVWASLSVALVENSSVSVNIEDSVGGVMEVIPGPVVSSDVDILW